MDSEMQEKCGVYGVFNHPKAAEITYYGLHALLQRGQESVRIVASEGNHSGGNGISYLSIITGHP
ncbi:amidophosphoribosyltransferase [Peribacillus simplex]|uniref:Amidophosphoribosyltransferase n=1 Tax=Peribacillus simplex TaxID=1478 RepID=A0AAN2TU67_9BACI|nr:amidophosphoribosyltransferase [Peribacillus simplex]